MKKIVNNKDSVAEKQEQTNPIEEAGNLNSEEVQVLIDSENKTPTVSTKNMDDILNTITEEFNLFEKGYSLTSFKETSKNSTITLSNGKYDLSVTIH